jgi:hypothetical protein
MNKISAMLMTLRESFKDLEVKYLGKKITFSKSKVCNISSRRKKAKPMSLTIIISKLK